MTSTANSPRIVAIIPARLGSSRFPGKPLAPILGLPMIRWVYRHTAACPLLHETYVATCDKAIFNAVEGFGGKAVMTADTHLRASDRVAEAAQSIEADIYVMVQGDEPMVTPDMIEAALCPMIDDPSIPCVNLMKRIGTRGEVENRNVIKVVTSLSGSALYFSREPIPTSAVLGQDAVTCYKQVCIIPFRREALQRFHDLPPTPLEVVESIDMLRFLEHGSSVRMIETHAETHAVDTPEDLILVEKLMRNAGLDADSGNSLHSGL
ncbi:3-deoxy-manno-octulosonate cytidylyltransferase [Desulfolutivibrio sp.]|uniref:3-deoxy-manno-octulosonate cytidylyltransferase n=1 Tax=Desulfolutivibrio sp. TaxID=2773296 RepID=UPI002F96E4C2